MEGAKISNWRWGYVILLCKFIVVSMMSGVVKSFGVLMPEMVKRLDGSYATVGFTCSLAGAFVYFSSPVVSVILGRVNHRFFAMVGGLMSGLCLGSCAFVSSNFALGVLLSLTGVGLACVFMPLTLLLNDYFDQNFILVNTVSLYGLTAGAMTLPFITERSLQAYGYHGVYAILAGIMLHITACAAAIRKPIFLEGTSRNDSDKLACPDMQVRCSPDVDKHNNLSRTCDEIVLENNATETKTEGQNSYAEHDLSDTVRCPEMDKSDELVGLRAPLVSDLGIEKDSNGKDRRYTDSWHNPCSKMNNCFPFNEPIFSFSLLVSFIDGVAIYAWMLFLIPHATFSGFSESEAVFLSTIGGIGGVLGRTVLLFLLSRNVDPLRVYLVIATVCSVTFVLDFLDEYYLERAFLAFVQGMCFFVQDTASFAFLKITLKHEENFTLGAGVQCFSFGTGALSSGYIIGFFFDVTQSYTTVFYIIGSVEAFFAICTILILIFIRRNNQREVFKSS